MRRFPDFSGLVARGCASVFVVSLGAAVLWLVQLSADGRDQGLTAIEHEGASREHALTLAGAAVQVSTEELSALGQQLWQDYVPAAVRDQYEGPSYEELRQFLVRLELELQGESASQIASYERDARRAMRVLRRHEGGVVFAAWLEPRLDLLKAAAQLEASASPTGPEPTDAPATVMPYVPTPAPGVDGGLSKRPQYTRAYWDNVMLRRKPPARAAVLVPRLKEIFVAMGVPPQLVWIAEVESAMNPEAVSPVGARGLFQFMPLTAARFGLDTGVMLDERTDPEKSARAAAAYLRVLHQRFQSWPLALAAYNAGEGRVGRALASEKATTFEAVAHRLPLETRLYVPKVLATVAARETVDPDQLPEPTLPAAHRPEPVHAVDDGAVAPDPGEAGTAAASL